MDEFLKTLQQKEKELQTQLEKIPIFLQLESVRNTIRTFSGISESPNVSTPVRDTIVPDEYEPTASWNKRILFIINKLGKPYVADIIGEMKKLGSKETDVFLNKRVSVMVNQLKRAGKIDMEMDGKRGKYFIK